MSEQYQRRMSYERSAILVSLVRCSPCVVWRNAVAARIRAECVLRLHRVHPMSLHHDDEDHVPHLVPADPIVKVTRFDVAIIILVGCLAVVYLVLMNN